MTQTLFKKFKTLISTFKVHYLIIFVLGIFFTFVIPPFQKPDETGHFYRTISLANGNFKCKTIEGREASFIPKYLFTLPDDLLSETVKLPDKRVPFRSYIEILGRRNFDIQNVPEYSCFLNPLPYVLQAMVLWLPVSLHLNPLLIFYLGRLAMFITIFFVFILALYKSPRQFRPLIFFTMILPMTMHQITSYNKDALLYGFGILGFSLFTKGYIQQKRLAIMDYLLYIFSSIILFLVHTQYLIFFLLIPFVSFRWSTLKKIGKLPIILLFTLFFFITVYIYWRYMRIFHQLLDPYLPYVSPYLQFELIKFNPLRFISVIGQTITSDFDFYVKGMIGILGRFDVYLPQWIYLVYIVVFAGLGFEVRRFIKISLKQILILSLILLFFVFFYFISFYLCFTPVGADKIVGIQGRYFTILIPYIVVLAAGVANHLKKIHAVIILYIVVLCAISFSTYLRFYNFSTSYYRDFTFYQYDITKKPFVFKKNETLIRLIDLNTTHMLVGISFMPLVSGQNKILPSYKIEIKDSNCSRLISERFMDSSVLKEREIYDILFPRLLNQKPESICVIFKPFYNWDIQEDLRIASSTDDKPAIGLLYSY